MVAITVSTGFCADAADADELPAISHIKLGFGAQGTISIPVTMIPAEEVPHYQSLLKEKTKAQVAELVGLVKRSLPEETTSSTDFLKRMALANQLTLQFSTEAKELFSLIPPQNNYDILEGAIRTQLAYPGIEFPEGKTLRVPITSFSSAEDAEMYSGFFIRRAFSEAKTLVDFAQGYFAERPIAALDFLNFMKVTERFESLEQAREAISVIEEGKRDPGSLAGIFEFDLSCLTLKFAGKGNVDIPVATFQIDEVEVLNALLKGKTREEVDSAVSLIKSDLIQKIIPSSDFLILIKNAFPAGPSEAEDLASDLASKLNF